MKKMIICLLALLCLIPAVLAENAVEPVLRMELSQTLFTGPQEVTVTISVSNLSEQEPLGPMALYWPDGRMIEEFGTPTLAAGESRTWEGVWAVTESQLKQGRVVFALQYMTKEADGSTSRKTQSYYVPVVWKNETPRPQQVKIVLDGEPNFGYSWDWGLCNGRLIVDISCDVSESGEACYTLTGRETGDTKICFTYDESWYTERNPNFARFAIYYDIRVDEEMNVSILNTEFIW